MPSFYTARHATPCIHPVVIFFFGPAEDVGLNLVISTEARARGYPGRSAFSANWSNDSMSWTWLSGQIRELKRISRQYIKQITQTCET